jgi:hypothetical protein
MTVVPPPASPCVRVGLVYTNGDGSEASSRFYLSYSGAAPSAANCNTLATDIATAWNTDMAGVTSEEWTLTEVDVIDIATDMGLSGTAAVSHPGTQAGGSPPAQIAVNCEFDIARRYRGGKPRWYQPGGGDGDFLDSAHWTSAFVTANNTAVVAFFAAIAALTVGSMGVLAHVNLSYYKGFTNVTNSSGRERAAPKYRDAALVDTITGYSTKALFGSQRRRRASTTP